MSTRRSGRNRRQVFPQLAPQERLQRILDTLKIPVRPRGKPIGPGIWVQWWLRQGPDYVWSIWTEYVRFIASLGYRTTITYHNFAKHIWYLKRLGLIEPSGRQAPISGTIDRSFYRLVPGKQLDPRFQDPVRALYGKRPRV